MKKNRLMTFLCACIPGAGQMYYGYMRRGLSLIALFCLGFGLTAMFSVFGVVLPVIWMYSFFDTYDLANRLLNGVPKEDDYLFLRGDFSLELFARLPRANRVLGWGMVGLGVWALYTEFLRPLLVSFFGWYFVDQIPTVVVAVLLIWGGVCLLGGRKGAGQPPRSEDLPFPGSDDAHTQS